MSLDEPEPVDSVLTFLSGYDTLEYSWVKATTISVRLQILFVTLHYPTCQPLQCSSFTFLNTAPRLTYPAPTRFSNQ